jgi:hypothetical protein
MAAVQRMASDMVIFGEALLKALRLSWLLEGRAEEWVCGCGAWQGWIDDVRGSFKRMDAADKTLEKNHLLVKAALTALTGQYRDPRRHASPQGPNANATVYNVNPTDLLLGSKRAEPPTLSPAGASSVNPFLLLFCRKDGYIWIEVLTNVDRHYTHFKRSKRTASKQLRRVEEARHVALHLFGSKERALRRLDDGGLVHGAFHSWKKDVEAEKTRAAYQCAALAVAQDPLASDLETPLMQQKQMGSDGAGSGGTKMCCCCCC